MDPSREREEEAPRPAPPRRSSQQQRGSPRFPTHQLVAAGIAAVLTIGALVYGFYRLEKFLIHDPRFALAGAEDEPSVEITGASHVSRRALERVFAADQGGSVYLIPLAARRDSVRSVDWVRDAAVARVWPNRVTVRIWERKPVAFVRVTSSRFGMMDEDGVILPPAADKFTLPVLAGVRAADPIDKRRDGARRMLRLLAELPQAAQIISEVDVSDGDNLRITLPYNGQSLTLLLGDRNFAARYANFVNSYKEIHKRLPDATVLDLRLEDRITAVD